MRIAVLVLLGACVPGHRFDEFQDLPKHDAMPQPDGEDPRRTVVVPSGIAIEGNESAAFETQPVHRVFTSSFEITASCVDAAWYGECQQFGRCDANTPLPMVTQDQAAEFCRYIHMRLPTEAELERAMRGDQGGTSVEAPTAYGLAACGNGELGVWTSDAYECDAYVGRAWSNPVVSTGGPALYRRFASVLGERSLATGQYAIRCVNTLDMSTPPAPPVQPTCTSGSCATVGLALGERFGCAQRADGSTWCWGDNSHGQLGTNDTLDAMPASTARPVATSATAQIAAGSTFACRRTTTGAVECWGANNLGQVAGASGAIVRAPAIVIASGATAISAAVDHACAIVGGDVVCWGNGSGIASATGVVTATAIASGRHTDCAIVANGSVQCLGATLSGTYVTTPAATSITVGDTHVCAVAGTTVQCWGDRSAWGAIGDATVPETLAGTFVAPRVFAAPHGTVVIDQGAIALDVGTEIPSTTTTLDGVSIAFSGSDACGTGSGNPSCFGVERGELGRGNGCEPTPSSSPLLLP